MRLACIIYIERLWFRMDNVIQQLDSKRHEISSARYAVYFRLLSAGVLLMFMIFMPYLADYYLLRPGINILEYYNQYVVDRYYEFEAVLINSFMLATLCYTGTTGVSMLAFSAPLIILAHASGIKYAARNELFRLDDLKLTEAAGMALKYLDFKLAKAQLFAVGMALPLCACGFILDGLRKKYPLPFRGIHRRKQAFALLRVLAGSALLVFMACYGYKYIESENSMSAVDRRDVLGTGNDRYVLYNFLKNDRYSNITADNVNESYGYIGDRIRGMENDIGVVGSRKPAVIVIMNESWWNTDNVRTGNIFSSDPMAVYKDLAKKCSAGGSLFLP